MGRGASLPKRLDTSVSDAPTIEQAHHLMAQLQVGNAELFRNAMELLGWCVREVQDGRRIASISEEGESVREMTMPIISPARVQKRILVNDEGLQQIAHLVENPPAPTPALRDLMVRTRHMKTAAPSARSKAGPRNR